MKVSKLTTNRGFAKKLTSALRVKVVIEEMNEKNHTHFHIYDEFEAGVCIIVCIDENELTFSLGDGNHSFHDPLEYPFELFTKFIAFLNKEYKANVNLKVSDIEGGE